MIKKLATIAFAFLTFLSASAQKVNEPQSTNAQWSQPYEPFRIVGNVYYVGTYDLASYLIVTPKGNILINTGLAASGPMIKKNIEALGFKLADTKILLTTQAHHDHLGAMAEIKSQTGAQMIADDQDASVIQDGGSSDYAFGSNGSTFAPVQVDRKLKNKDEITLGETRLMMLHHPGHTKGSCSYVLDVKDGQRVYKVLIVNMPTIVVDKKFSDIPAYTNIAKDYAYTFDALKKQSFDIWLSSHASQFGLHAKHKPGDAPNPEAFVDPKGYEKAVNDLEVVYLKKMAKE